jgi:circadian clock protein KaiC
VPGLDSLIGGGLARGHVALVLGSSGVGKSILGLHFLDEGARRKQRGLHFGFYERPETLLRRAHRLGMLEQKKPLVTLSWRVPAEQRLDELGAALLDMVAREGVERLFIDGIEGFQIPHEQERLPGFLSALTHELTRLGVTTLFTQETNDLLLQQVAIPAPPISATFDDIILLAHIERRGELVRLISIAKTRDSGNEPLLRRFAIGDRGMSVGDPYLHDDGGRVAAPPRRRK